MKGAWCPRQWWYRFRQTTKDTLTVLKTRWGRYRQCVVTGEKPSERYETRGQIWEHSGQTETLSHNRRIYADTLIYDVLFETELSNLTRYCCIVTDHQYPSRSKEDYQPRHSYLPTATPQNISGDVFFPENGPTALYDLILQLMYVCIRGGP
jgi:hypothetical protein